MSEADTRTKVIANIQAERALWTDLVTRPDAFPWLDGTALADAELFGHLHDEHEPSIRAWLAERA